ncbi:hypothetical protein BC829DRAFT_195218 [Chytridium lagenaria]|nr:hypothetical protein BC829DRAFT_195218 [Chytridium lagenaria]
MGQPLLVWLNYAARRLSCEVLLWFLQIQRHLSQERYLRPFKRILPDGPCIMFGAARALDGTTYHLGTRNGAPYVAKLNNDMSIVDTDFLVLHRDTLATLTSGKVINGGAIALNQVTGEVYSAWNFDDNTVTILKYAPSTKSISLFTSTPAGANTKVSSLYVLPNGVLMTVGITLNRFDRDGLPSAGKASAFAGWWVDPRDGSSGKLQDIKVWVVS